MATVYLAEDLKHHRKVAIKVLHAELSAVLGPDRFIKEIGLTVSLEHAPILHARVKLELDARVRAARR